MLNPNCSTCTGKIMQQNSISQRIQRITLVLLLTRKHVKHSKLLDLLCSHSANEFCSSLSQRLCYIHFKS